MCSTHVRDEAAFGSLKHCTGAGFSLNFELRTLFAVRSSDGKIIAMPTTNVGDLLYGFLPEGAAAMHCILDRFQAGKVESPNPRCCGECHAQDGEYNMTVAGIDNTERIGFVTYDNARKLDTPCGEAEIAQLRSISHHCHGLRDRYGQRCHIDMIAYKLVPIKPRSSTVETETVSSLMPGIPAVMVCTFTDTKFCNAVKYSKGGRQEQRSQQGCVVALASPEVLNGQTASVHPIC